MSCRTIQESRILNGSVFHENELDYYTRELNVEQKELNWAANEMQLDMCLRYYVFFKTMVLTMVLTIEDPI